LVCVALTRKHSRNNNTAAARLVGRRQWLRLVDPRKWQRLTGHRKVNLMDRRPVNLTGHLQVRA
jgi:hypothetical protein